jgi:acetoin utilization deacetylase AcuC-like enzyme
MKRTGLLFDQRFMLHDTGPYHPEMSQRLIAIFKGLRDADLLSKLFLVEAEPADRKWIETVHAREYIDRFGDACAAGSTEFDYPDNQMCCETYDTAVLVVGGILNVIDALMEGKIDNAFCAVRPPGHHAEINKGMGFCYFNNVAIAARYLQKQWGIKDVGIVDFDVHHGNGTQQIFEEDPTVFYYSIHQHPSFAFPGTGRDFEEGTGAGLGFTKNSVVLPGQGDEEYKVLIEKDLVPSFERFQPEFILVSAGFDSHEDDDMADVKLSTEGFSWMMKRLMDMGNTYAQGRIVSVLEGGYCLKRLPELIANHVSILLDG